MTQSVELNLTSSAFKANPYPAFAHLRANDPVHLLSSSDGLNNWLITRYEDAVAILRDERFVKNRRSMSSSQTQVSAPPSIADLMGLSMLKFDPPDHTRLRSLVSLSFTPRLIEQWRERIQSITDELIDAVENQGGMDVIKQFAFPLPMLVISEIMGVPVGDGERLHLWIKRIVDALPAAHELAAEELQACYNYLLELIESKRQAPADDLVSKLILAEAEGDRLSVREVMAMIFLLIMAGHETTSNLIGNSMLALLTHPEQMALLRQDPTLIKTAVEEFLRFYSPLTLATLRWAREDVEFGGKLIQRGDMVDVSLASANRDETVFANPDNLDITRQESLNLAFSKGIHYCLGAPLARLEGQIAIGTLLRRLPNLRLQVDPSDLVWRPGSMVLGVNTLPVAF
jgi:cytochrome P450